MVLDCRRAAAVIWRASAAATTAFLVAEPTIFGVHNLALVLKLVRLFGKPCRVVINKTVPSKTIAEDFCRKEKVQVLESIPLDLSCSSCYL